MSATPIADMIEAMLAQGAPLAAIVVAVRAFETERDASRFPSRDASRDGVTKPCNLFSLSEVIGEQRGNQEEGLPTVIVEGKKPKVSRGTRLSADTAISDDDRQFARDAGMSDGQIAQAWAEFIDYWISTPGQRGTKLDWPATWRNRVRNITGKAGHGQGRPRAFSNGGKQHPADLALDLADQARELERQAGIGR